jgi:2-dehydro-3-deoxygluconokinase
MLLRLSARGREQLLQSPCLEVCVGGAEANVAVSAARLGTPSKMVSILPDNVLGHQARDELRRHGVDTSGVQWGPGRMGLYFHTAGAVLLPSEVLYDRVGSAFDLAAPDLVDWPSLLDGASRLHLSGVTPALGANSAEAALRAARAACDLSIPVSMDGNYRAKLWQRWNGGTAPILRGLFETADIAFADERDIGLVLGETFAGDRTQQLTAAAAAAFAAFPRLRMLACTRRTQCSVDHHELSATLVTRDRAIAAGTYELHGVVDRMGAGDAFVAGLLHAIHQSLPHEQALDFALAAAVLKHSIPGDFNLITERDVQTLLSQEGLHVRR